MMKSVVSSLTLISLPLAGLLGLPGAEAATFNLLQEYKGSTWFDEWNFYGDEGVWNGVVPWDNSTVGDVFYMGRQNGSSLAFVDQTSGRAIVKVDNTTFVPFNQKRDSIRLTTKAAFSPGTIWVTDLYHIPWGCSVWPSIWTKGLNWPDDGEIDIIEGVNRQTSNTMALHTLTGCMRANGTDQTGTAGPSDCAPKTGCTVGENGPNSYGQAFADNGGGVWATMFDNSGVFIWYWTRSAVPAGLVTDAQSVDPTTWGPPSGSWPSSSCNIPDFFGHQSMVIDITLCGQFAGLPSVYSQTCDNTPTQADPTTRCYVDNVINNGTSDLAMAYFEFGAIRVFSDNTTAPTLSTSASPSSSTSGSSSSTSAGAGATNTNNPNQTNDNSPNGARVLVVPVAMACLVGALTGVAWMLL